MKCTLLYYFLLVLLISCKGNENKVPPPSPPTALPTYSPIWSAVDVLGPYNMAPWSLTSFPNTSAQWIWNVPNAQSSAPKDVKIYFERIFTSPVAQTGTLSFQCDDICTSYFNGVKLGNSSNFHNLNQKSVNIVAGSNSIVFYAYNNGTSSTSNPAGLIACLLSSNNKIITNYSWQWTLSAVFAPTVAPTNAPTIAPTNGILSLTLLCLIIY